VAQNRIFEPADGAQGAAHIRKLVCQAAPNGAKITGSMTCTIEIDFPATLLLHDKGPAALERRSRFLLALKFFELGEITSGQAANMCGMGRVAFLSEASRCGVPVVELSDEELSQEFDHA
jgi:predicted HTH domain antitoxin